MEWQKGMLTSQEAWRNLLETYKEDMTTEERVHWFETSDKIMEELDEDET